MYLIDRDQELTPTRLGTILQNFQTRDLAKLRRYRNYYDGKQAIIRKQATDTGKPCNKVVVNYCYNIAQNYLGYIAGIPIGYEGKEMDNIQDILLYNDVKNEDSEYLRNALIYGVAYELCYIDELGKQRFKILDPRNCVPIYDNTVENQLLYVIRFWREDRTETSELEDHYYVEVYGPNTVKKYRSNAGFVSFELLAEVPHFYGQCPITVFNLNEDQASIYDQVISLQDAYNNLLSGEIDDFDSFADAYLLMKGVVADEAELNQAKKSRAFMVDNDADISYLTKNISDTQIQNMLTNIDAQIHKIANSPDFSQESFGVSSGIALKFRLLGFENNASSIETQMRKALQRRIELLCEVENIKSGDTVWRDVDIIFTRNLPVDTNETINLVNSLRGLVSDETLLGLLPFVDSAKEELDKVNKQKKENMAMYGFNDITADEEENENG